MPSSNSKPRKAQASTIVPLLGLPVVKLSDPSSSSWEILNTPDSAFVRQDWATCGFSLKLKINFEFCMKDDEKHAGELCDLGPQRK